MEELISQALQEDMHIVVLALYVLGTVLKRIKAVPDCLIPVFLRASAWCWAFWWRAACRA